MSGTPLCTGVGCAPVEHGATGDAPRRRSAAGGLLCAGCRNRLSVHLRRLPDLFDLCEDALDGSGGADAASRHVRVSGGGTPTGLPLNVAACEARKAMVAVLSSWAGLVAEENRTPPPSRNVTALCDYLVRHLDWLVRHSSAGEASREIALLTRRAARVADPVPRRTVPAGPCVSPGCGGALTAVTHGDGAGRPVEVRCDRDTSHRWSGGEWAEHDYRRRQRGAADPRWMSAGQIARLWNVPSGSVYRLASVHDWRRRRASGRTYYHEGDVTRSLHHRAAAE